MFIIGIIITWLLIGFVSSLFAIASDVRGKKYDELYFDSDIIPSVFMMIVLGPISFVAVLYIVLHDSDKLKRFIYELVNIGIKEEDRNE